MLIGPNARIRKIKMKRFRLFSNKGRSFLNTSNIMIFLFFCGPLQAFTFTSLCMIEITLLLCIFERYGNRFKITCFTGFGIA